MKSQQRHSPVRKELGELLVILSKLHTRAARTAIPSTTTNVTADYIVDTVTECGCPLPQARLIAQTITTHPETTKSRITALRASPVFRLPTTQQSWPLVEWTEDDRNGLALFHFDRGGTKHGTYSWIMHSGTRNSVHWVNPLVKWDVGNLGHLKLLFEVAQHVLDILEWPITDSLVLYAHLTPREYSQEQYAPPTFALLIGQAETLGRDVEGISQQIERCSLEI